MPRTPRSIYPLVWCSCPGTYMKIVLIGAPPPEAAFMLQIRVEPEVLMRHLPNTFLQMSESKHCSSSKCCVPRELCERDVMLTLLRKSYFATTYYLRSGSTSAVVRKRLYCGQQFVQRRNSLTGMMEWNSEESEYDYCRGTVRFCLFSWCLFSRYCRCVNSIFMSSAARVMYTCNACYLWW